MPARRCYFAAAVVLSAAMAAAAEWTVVEIDNGGKTTLRVEVATTPSQRRKGLSGRTEALATNTGMLFVFNPPQTVCMWMKDTHIPLAAAFVGADGRVVKTALMRPHSTYSHCVATKVTHVLETHPRLLGSALAVGATVRVVTR